MTTLTITTDMNHHTVPPTPGHSYMYLSSCSPQPGNNSNTTTKQLS